MTLLWRGEDTRLDAVRAGDVVTLKGDGVEATFDVVNVAGPEWVLSRDGRQHVAHVARVKDAAWVHVDGRTHVVEMAGRPSTRRAEGDGTLVAPMTGRILDVPRGEGEAVAAGDVVVVLSAMKMRVELKAPFAGRVSKLSVRTGEQVEGGAVLAVVERTS